MECPHCRVAFHEQIEHIKIGQDKNGQWHIIKSQCPECGNLILCLSNRSSSSGGEIGSLSENYGAPKEILVEYMIRPLSGSAPLANRDLPDDIKSLYEEASTIADLSPKGAAALLRLAVEMLCKHLGGKGPRLDDDIAFLVKQGLPVNVQKSLDIVRIVGNNAVHPGFINIDDDPTIVHTLFGLVNIIAETMITQQKHRRRRLLLLLYDAPGKSVRRLLCCLIGLYGRL